MKAQHLPETETNESEVIQPLLLFFYWRNVEHVRRFTQRA